MSLRVCGGEHFSYKIEVSPEGTSRVWFSDWSVQGERFRGIKSPFGQPAEVRLSNMAKKTKYKYFRKSICTMILSIK